MKSRIFLFALLSFSILSGTSLSFADGPDGRVVCSDYWDDGELKTDCQYVIMEQRQNMELLRLISGEKKYQIGSTNPNYFYQTCIVTPVGVLCGKAIGYDIQKSTCVVVASQEMPIACGRELNGKSESD